jgi:hypothetical protein
METLHLNLAPYKTLQVFLVCSILIASLEAQIKDRGYELKMIKFTLPEVTEPIPTPRQTFLVSGQFFGNGLEVIKSPHLPTGNGSESVVGVLSDLLSAYSVADLVAVRKVFSEESQNILSELFSDAAVLQEERRIWSQTAGFKVLAALQDGRNTHVIVKTTTIAGTTQLIPFVIQPKLTSNGTQYFLVAGDSTEPKGLMALLHFLSHSDASDIVVEAQNP